MPVSKAKAAADYRAHRKIYEHIPFVVRFDAEINGKVIRAHAAVMGESMNGFITRAVHEAIERDRQQLNQ